jgi:hypothetical protein
MVMMAVMVLVMVTVMVFYMNVVIRRSWTCT